MRPCWAAVMFVAVVGGQAWASTDLDLMAAFGGGKFSYYGCSDDCRSRWYRRGHFHDSQFRLRVERDGLTFTGEFERSQGALEGDDIPSLPSRMQLGALRAGWSGRLFAIEAGPALVQNDLPKDPLRVYDSDSGWTVSLLVRGGPKWAHGWLARTAVSPSGGGVAVGFGHMSEWARVSLGGGQSPQDNFMLRTAEVMLRPIAHAWIGLCGSQGRSLSGVDSSWWSFRAAAAATF